MSKFLLLFSIFMTAPSLQAHPTRLKVPARAYLEGRYLPSLSGKILYIGVGSYTRYYGDLTQSPETFFTLDYDEAKAAFGSPSGHYIADFLTFDPGFKFDHVSLFGVMGHDPDVKTSRYTIIDGRAIDKAIEKAHQLVKIGGTLQLGPNHQEVPEQGVDFWMNKLGEPPLNHYKVIFFAIGPDNVFWWGRKLEE